MGGSWWLIVWRVVLYLWFRFLLGLYFSGFLNKRLLVYNDLVDDLNRNFSVNINFANDLNGDLLLNILDNFYLDRHLFLDNYLFNLKRYNFLNNYFFNNFDLFDHFLNHLDFLNDFNLFNNFNLFNHLHWDLLVNDLSRYSSLVLTTLVITIMFFT